MGLSSYRKLSDVESHARKIMGDDPAHGWPHVVRVMRNAEVIVAGEGISVDWAVLRASIYLHDVGRFLPGDGHHAAKSASYAVELLARLGFPGELIDAVVHAIEAHSYSYGVKPASVEAVVLSDADKLDALGAIGIARVFHHGCISGRGFDDSVAHMVEKLLDLPSKLILSTSRRLAEDRLSIIKEFISQYHSEVSRV